MKVRVSLKTAIAGCGVCYATHRLLEAALRGRIRATWCSLRFCVHEFEMRGATWFSDGVPAGHTLPVHSDRYSLQPERSFKEPGGKEVEIRRYKERQLSHFPFTGRQRLIKSVSVKSSPSDPASYGPGFALGQEALLVPKDVRVL